MILDGLYYHLHPYVTFTSVVWSLGIIILSYVLYQRLWSPLGKIPGPFLASISGITYYTPSIFTGKAFQVLQQWHLRYGPVIRTGPNAVSVTDPDVVKLVCLNCPKHPLYERIQYDQPTTLSTTDILFHKKRRKLISPAFSILYLNSLEPHILEGIHTFMDQMNRRVGQPLDLCEWFHFFTLDMMGETAFGETFHLMTRGHCKLVECMGSNLRYRSLKPFLPFLDRLSFLPRVTENNNNVAYINEFVQGLIKKRRMTKLDRGDIMNILLDSQDPETGERLSDAELSSEVILFVFAGSETTSSTLAWVVYLILTHSEVYARLQEELDQQFSDKEQPIDHESTKDLPYLMAVIHEAMRYLPTVSVYLPRVANRDVKVGSYTIPAGTTIAIPIYAIHRSPLNWKDPDRFDPDRFFMNESLARSNNAFLPFLIGPRQCVGKNFAMMEIKMILAALFRRFSLKLVPEQNNEPVCHITLRPKDGLKVILSNRGFT